MSDSARIEAAQLFDSLASELEQAVAHARTAAEHYRSGETARGAAHGFAVQGHWARAGRTLEQLAEIHAAHARPL